GLWTDAVRWCGGRAAVAAGHGSVDTLLDAVRTVRGLSESAIRRSLDDIGALLPYVDARHVAAARATFARLDSRPLGLRRASQVATDRLGDVPLAEPLDQRLLVLAGVDYPELVVWDARYHGDARALVAQARDNSLTLDARFNALGYLLGISADTPATLTAVERLLAEDPDDWDERGRYVDMHVRSHRLPDAGRVPPAVLNDSQHPLSPSDWRHVVGPAFARVFGRRPSSEGDSAFEALARGGVPAKLLTTIPSAAADSGFLPLALALKQRLLPPVVGDDAEAVEFYR